MSELNEPGITQEYNKERKRLNKMVRPLKYLLAPQSAIAREETISDWVDFTKNEVKKDRTRIPQRYRVMSAP